MAQTYDYIEPALSKAVALSPEALAAARRDVQVSGIRVETMNWFLPGGDIKLTGPAVDREQVRAYLEKSLALAESFGAKVIVFGSPYLAFENEDPDVVLQAGPLIARVQILDPVQRGFPRDDAGEPRYRRFFENLRKVGYRGRISVEAESKDLAGDCGPALQFLKRMAAPPKH